MDKTLLNEIYFSLFEIDSGLKTEEREKKEYALIDIIEKLYDDGHISSHIL